ncbi:TPA: restriction endonuclease subunit S [Staphylococcus aureus]|nr:restriction endonuclease subunit S [Staphylococcus aureus]HEH3380364.1 restriction endonuclease subunit S [Staphylococcus aureus]
MSNTQKKNVPELRFPGFEGEWEEKKLGEVATFAKGKLGAKKDVSQNGVPVILYGELYTKYGAIVSKIFSKTDIPENKLKMAKKNDVLIPSSGETAIDIATASINGINKNELSKYAQGKTVVHLYNNDIKNLKIAFPSEFEEQVRIGNFFSKLDRQIELEEQKLELLQQQKKGYMQKIFSQELRFKDENGNDYPKWEEKKIEDIASQVYGGGTPNTKIKEFWNGDIPWIQSSDVKVNDLILQQCNKFISKNSIELSSAKLIPANSIAIVTRVGVGKLCLVEFDYATSQDFLSLSSLKYDKLYSLYSLLYTMKKISANLQGTSIKGITKKELLDSIIKIPHNLEEQQKIGDLFYKIDKYISFNKCKIEILKSLKQGLLKKMFI